MAVPCGQGPLRPHGAGFRGAGGPGPPAERPGIALPSVPSPHGYTQRERGRGGGGGASRQRGQPVPLPRPRRGPALRSSRPSRRGAAAPHPSPHPAHSPALGLVGRRPSPQVNAYPSASAVPSAGLAAPWFPDGNCYGRPEQRAGLWREVRELHEGRRAAARETAARRGLRRRAAVIRCEPRRRRKPPGGRVAPLSSPRPSAVPGRGKLARRPGLGCAAAERRQCAAAERRGAGETAAWLPPASTVTPYPSAGLRGARRGVAGSAAPPGALRAPRGGRPGGAGAAMSAVAARGRTGERRHLARPHPSFGACPALPPWSGGARGVALRGGRPGGSPAGPASPAASCFVPALPLSPPSGDRATARALTLPLGQPRQRPVAPVLTGGGAGAPSGRAGSEPPTRPVRAEKGVVGRYFGASACRWSVERRFSLMASLPCGMAVCVR